MNFKERLLEDQKKLKEIWLFEFERSGGKLDIWKDTKGGGSE